MIRLLFWGLLAYGLWRMVCHIIRLQARLRATQSSEKPGVDDVLVEDPVCGARVPKQQALVHRSWGKTTYFCSEECRSQAGRKTA